MVKFEKYFFGTLVEKVLRRIYFPWYKDLEEIDYKAEAALWKRYNGLDNSFALPLTIGWLVGVLAAHALLSD